MSGGLPTALAVAGTALMAVAIFGPFRKPVEPDEPSVMIPDPPAIPQWPALVEATAIACDARARIDLADALGALQSPWAAAILQQAYETEGDPDVRSAIAKALALTHTLVT